MITPAAVKVLLLLCCQLLILAAEDVMASAAADAASGEFSRHTVARPRFFHAAGKAEIHHTRRNDTGIRHHLDRITVRVEVDGGRELILDLALNDRLIPDTYFEKFHQKVGTTSLNFCSIPFIIDPICKNTILPLSKTSPK